MRIEVACGACGKKFRVPEKYGGKRVKCPGCRGPIDVKEAPARERRGRKASGRPSPVPDRPTPRRQSTPPPEGPPPPAPAETPQWFMQGEDGEEYGPITRTELDAWYADGRVDGSCQILCEGWENWKWADEVFGGLNEQIEEVPDANPFAGIGDAAEAQPNAFAVQQGPVAPPVQAQQPAEEGEISGHMFDIMRQTRPWVMLLAILGFCIAGLMAIGALISLATGGVPGIIMGIPSLIICGLYGYGAYLLLDYAQKIQIFLRRKGAQELEKALFAQRTFWKVAGIITLTAIALGIVMVVLSILVVGAMMATFSQTQ